jgi:hypothetical protein
MSTQPDLYRFDPGEDKKRKETEEDYTFQGWSVQEIPDEDGSGAVTVVFTPPDEVPVKSTSNVQPVRSTDSTHGRLAWGAKVSEGFRDKVRAIAADLGCDPDFLMASMAFETGETFSPKIKNPQSGATGLIQFMPSTAKALGTTTNDLANMSPEDQLDFVAKYFNDHKGKLHTLEDVYMAILWPAAVGKEIDYVLFAKPSQAYEQNKGLDSNKDGKVTKAEAAAKVLAKLENGRRPEHAG